MGYIPPKDGFDEAMIEAVRIKAQSLIDREKLKRSHIAKEIDVPEGTLGPWLNGKYPGDNAGVAEKVDRWLQWRADKQAEMRVSVTRPGFVMTPTADAVLRTLDHAQMFGKLVLVPLKPGSGKTMACDQQRQQRNRVYLATMAPSTSGVATALAEVLAAMGEPDAKGAPAVLARRIRAKVKEHGALIILDEAQHLSVQAIEELRAIQDATGCGMALVGDERLSAVFDGTAYAQLRRRIARRCPPVRTLDEDVRTVAGAWGVTAKDEIDFLRRVAKQPGALGGVANVIEMATQLAALEEKPRDLGHMMSAWADLMPGQAL